MYSCYVDREEFRFPVFCGLYLELAVSLNRIVAKKIQIGKLKLLLERNFRKRLPNAL